MADKPVPGGLVDDVEGLPETPGVEAGAAHLPAHHSFIR